MLVAGEKEQSAGTVSIRQHTKGDIGIKSLNEFIDGVLKLAVPGINTISL
jgi:threonyl-tRNA synthetase